MNLFHESISRKLKFRSAFILLLILSYTSDIKANTANWFPIGAKWDWTVWCMQPSCAYFSIEITKDTVVNGKTYQKGEVTFYSEHYRQGKSEPESTILFEADNGKINYYYRGGTYRLYDFTLNPGDTMYTDITQLSYLLSDVFPAADTFMTAKNVVTSVENVLIDGVSLKRLNLSPVIDTADNKIYGLINDFDFSVTEKIGFDLVLGFFGLVYNRPLLTGGEYGYLRCYSDEDIFFQRNENIACDYIFVPYPRNTWFPIGATWYYETIQLTETNYGYLKMEVVKDTVIHSKPVSVIQREFVSLLHSGDTVYAEAEPLYMHESEGAIYQWHDGDFYLVFEYPTKIRDRIPVAQYSYEGDIPYAEIDLIWDVFIGNRKLYAFSVTDTVRVDEYPGCVTVDVPAAYEKIGSVYNFFPVITPCGYADYMPEAQYLRCYYDSQTGLITPDDLESPVRPRYLPCDTLVPFYHVGIQQKAFDRAVIYPNPADQIIVVDVPIQIVKMNIFSSDGKQVQSVSFPQNNSASIEEMTGGIYLIMAVLENGSLSYGKFIKR